MRQSSDRRWPSGRFSRLSVALANTVHLFKQKLLHLCVLSLMTACLLLSSLGMFLSHGIALLDAAGHEPHGEIHASHSHDHEHDEDVPEEVVALPVDGVVHSHAADNGQHGHNPLDHSHETANLPPLIAKPSGHLRHRLALMPPQGFFSHEPRRLERPPMPNLYL